MSPHTTLRWVESSGVIDKHRTAMPIARHEPRFSTYDRSLLSLTMNDSFVVSRLSLVARLADAFDLEDVVEDSEACVVSKGINDRLEFALSVAGYLDVLDCPARDTDEMVMVASEPLRELVSPHSIGSVVFTEHIRFFKDRECAIHRGHRNRHSRAS